MQATYKFVHNRKKQLLEDGTALVQLRITINRSVRYLSTGVYLTPKQWDEKSQSVVKHPNALKLNTLLSDKKRKVQDAELDALSKGLMLSLDDVSIDDKPTEKIKLTSFILKEASAEKGLALSTYNQLKSLCNVIDRSKLFSSIHSVSMPNIKAFDNWMLSKGLTVAYINKRHQQLSKYTRILYKRKMIATNPYDDFKLNKPAPSKRKFLSVEMLKKLSEHEFIPRLANVRDMFLFSCFTGLAYKDVVKLSRKDIYTYNGTRFIITDRTKTDEESAIPLLPQASSIIDKYSDPDNETLIPIISNQRFNGYLKEIQDICEIPITLTHHVARHTFATTITLENGVPIESVSRMLGHRSIKTTQIYSKITRDKLAKEMNQITNIIGL